MDRESGSEEGSRDGSVRRLSGTAPRDRRRPAVVGVVVGCQLGRGEGQFVSRLGHRFSPDPPNWKYARLDPAKFAGLREGDAHVIRNAGGRASQDAIRSLVISYKMLGTQEWFVIHHTDCGMELFNGQIINGLLEQSLETAKATADG